MTDFPVRLRCGKGQRLRLRMKARSQTEADGRKPRLETIAALLVRAGQEHAAPDVLQALCEQESEADFARAEKRALLRAKEAAARAVPRDAPVPSHVPQTFGELVQLWLSGDLCERFPNYVNPLLPDTAAHMRRRFVRINRSIGGIALAKLTEKDCTRALAESKQTGQTLVNYAGLIRRAVNIAAECEFIKASPLRPKWAPKLPPRRAMSFIYPDEDMRLLAFVEIPLDRRLLWGFLMREGPRIVEALHLTWSDLDLARGTLRLDKNKTNRPRTWKLDEGTCRALRYVRDQRGAEPHERVFSLPVTINKASELLREDARAAGLDRPEFYVHNEQRHQLHVHDLRGTFVTLALAAGSSEALIMGKTGHRTSKMVHAYDRDSSLARQLDYTDFLSPLDEALGLPRPASRVGQRVGQGRPSSMKYGASEGLAQTLPSIPGAPEGAKTPGKRTRGIPGKLGGPPHLGGVGQQHGTKDGPESEGADMSESVVEDALARAIDRASARQQWTVVAQLANELGERRRARVAPTVASLADARKRREEGGK